jgi:hypothetical protein
LAGTVGSKPNVPTLIAAVAFFAGADVAWALSEA